MKSGLERLLNNLKSYNPAKLIEDIVGQKLDYITSLQKDQLNAGLDGDGEKFTLKYSEDPYFKTPAAGRRYGAWKMAMNKGTSNLFPVRDIDTPNLSINGNLFHNHIISRTGSGKLIIDAASPIMSKLEGKYGKVLGLSPQAINIMLDAFLMDEFKRLTLEYWKK